MAKQGIYTVGRTELLDWVNELLGLSYLKIEEMSNGAAFCQVIDAVHPGSVALGRVNFAAVTEAEMIENYKILQDAFSRNGITQHIDVATLIKGRYMAALEMCQWIHSYFEQEFTGPTSAYDAPARRRSSKCKDVKPAARPPPAQKTTKPASAGPAVKHAPSAVTAQKAVPSRQVAAAKPPPRSQQPPQAEAPPVASGSDAAELKRLRKMVAKLEEDVEQRVQERDFYYAKLRRVEEFCQDHEDESPVKDILDILYEPDEEHGFLPPDDED
jgi:RP/EB family microtubule-associated protein